jgi:hypothetical protein
MGILVRLETEKISRLTKITISVIGRLRAIVTKFMYYSFKVCTNELKEFVTRE